MDHETKRDVYQVIGSQEWKNILGTSTHGGTCACSSSNRNSKNLCQGFLPSYTSLDIHFGVGQVVLLGAK